MSKVNSRTNGGADADGEDQTPSTPPAVHPPSQQSLPSTEDPVSPTDFIDPSSSFKTELNDDRITPSHIIPSSLTPPPSSQVRLNGTNGANTLGHASNERLSIFSPPATMRDIVRHESNQPNEYLSPTSQEIEGASVGELRIMFQSCLAENARLKMETAHHKLQFNLLTMQADEDAKRAKVEHDMTRREVEVLRITEDARQARRELSAAHDSASARYLQLKVWYEAALEENDSLVNRTKLAKKVIQQKEDEIVNLTDERDMLLNRIRENREHFHMLCSPGGAFHGALTPKIHAPSSPQQHRATPRQATRSLHHRDPRHGNDSNQAGFEALLQALNHENNSAPTTPTTAKRPTHRITAKHTRGVQSLSSLPPTPLNRSRGDHSALLPSADLVPQTEPAQRYAHDHFVAETPTSKRRRKSRESTISADDNEELARAALESVAAATQSSLSHGSRGSGSRSQRHNHDGEGEGEEEEVLESQASQAASEMLRRDPRESFEVASSVDSREVTPAPAEKSAKLQAKLFAPVNKAGLSAEKRKFSGATTDPYERKRDTVASSPSKKMRQGHKVGLGIQY